MVNVIDHKIICCPICWSQKRKHRTFIKDKDLNIHLKRKHDTKYKFYIAKGSAMVISRTKPA